jgi:uncharacterized damage-inducible protein DinB
MPRQGASMSTDVRLDIVTRLLAYDRKVFERFERSIARRGWAAAVENREIAHRSIKDTLVHILNVHEAWLVAVAQNRWEIFDRRDRRPQDITSFSDLRRYRQQVWVEIDLLMGGLTTARLRRRVTAPWMPGRYALEDAFFQSSFEQAHHLGEIIGAYWQKDWPPPVMTWIENLSPRRR